MSCCNNNCNHDPCGSSFNQAVTRAAQYAQYAQTQANSAAASLESFNEKYLGAFAVAPTGPQVTGALYWNLGSNTMFVWNGTTWIENGNFNEFTNFSIPFASTIPIANLVTGQEYEIASVGTGNWTAIGAASATVGVRFTKNAVAATGTGSARITRDLVTRFNDVVNVKDYGALGTPADDTAAIQAAITNNPGKAIYFPRGVYNISDTIIIDNLLTTLYCDTHENARIRLTNLSCPVAIKIQPKVGESEIFKPGIQNLAISRIDGSTYAVGVQVERARAIRMDAVEIYSFPTAINIIGGAIGYYTNLSVSSYGSSNTDPKTGVIQINDSNLGTAYGYTHLFDTCHITGGKYPIKIMGADHVSFSNCYIGRPGGFSSTVNVEGGVLIEPNAAQTIGSYNNNFDNCYFDRAVATGDLYAVTINDLTSPPPANATGTKFTDCVFTGWEKHIYINKAFDPTIEITGCRFDGAHGEAIDATGNFTNLVITGNQFYKNTLRISGRSTLDIKDAYSVAITGNIFSLIYVDPTAYPGTRDMIRLAGTITALTITGNAINNASTKIITDFVNTATIGKLVITGNASNNPVNTLGGHIIGNQANANPLALDWYEEKTFTPTLQFGGSSTGITYLQQTGTATRIGDRVFFDLYFQLSSKGSATGNATISGLPYNYSGAPACFTINAGGLDPAIGGTNIDAQRFLPNLIQPNKQVSGSSLGMTDADFTNTTFLTITGTYEAQ